MLLDGLPLAMKYRRLSAGFAHTPTGQAFMPMMKLGLFIEGGGHHMAAWRHPDVASNGRINIERFMDAARTAEPRRAPKRARPTTRGSLVSSTKAELDAIGSPRGLHDGCAGLSAAVVNTPIWHVG